MDNVDTADIMKILLLAASAASHGAAAYREARELAKKAGLTPEQLNEADERFAKIYVDPLKKD